MAQPIDSLPTSSVEDSPALLKDSGLEAKESASEKTPDQLAEEVRELREEMGGFEMMYVQETYDTLTYDGLTIRKEPVPALGGFVKKVEVGAPIWVGAKRVEFKPEKDDDSYPTTFAEVVYKDPQTQELYRGWAAVSVTGASGQSEVYLAPEK